MGHLTVDEIIRFVSLKELNRETLALSAAVNGHIRKCAQCRKQVNAFQLIYDEFATLRADGDFSRYACGLVSEKSVKTAELQQAREEFDGYR